MKKIAMVSLMALSMFGASAQQKIGYINTDELISVMPEAEKADAELKEYQASLSQQGQDLMKELGDKDNKHRKCTSKKPRRKSLHCAKKQWMPSKPWLMKKNIPTF